MRDYDHELADAKSYATKCLIRAQGAAAEGKDVASAFDELASAFDDLNKAWNGVTDALMRQRTVRDEEIVRLLNQIAEMRRVP